MEWISVKEKLPELDKPVLICYVGCHDKKLHNDAVAIYTKNKYADNLYSWYFTVDGRIVKLKIKYWAPLPEPPK